MCLNIGKFHTIYSYRKHKNYRKHSTEIMLLNRLMSKMHDLTRHFTVFTIASQLIETFAEYLDNRECRQYPHFAGFL